MKEGNMPNTAGVKMEFGVVGLGRMGGGLAIDASTKGMHVVGQDTGKVRQELTDAKVEVVSDLAGLKDKLSAPRAVFLYIPAGEAVDELIDRLADVLEKGDLIIDGGNSYWGDSIRRHARLKEKGIQFADLGTSGGVTGALHGACFMIGGERAAVERVEPILLQLAVPNGYVHAGPPGAGHFVKLVHNGIEFGMLQAIGEGVNLLESYRDRLPIADILKNWCNGSVIRSWLIELMEQAYRGDGGLKGIPPYVEDTGEVNWLVDDACHMEVPIPVIAQSVMQLFASRDEDKNWARAIAMMRHGFGGHPYGSDKGIVAERRGGRIGGYYKGPDPK
jgi:6-phosphogluconate dehydrogenase